jgi:hypothetical protein
LYAVRSATLKGEQMTFRSTLMFGLVIVLVLAMAPSSFAQVSLQLLPDVSEGEIQTNRNAQTASTDVLNAGILVSGSLIADSPLTTTTLRITYPAPITSSPASFAAAPSIPAADPIRIVGGSGLFATVTNGSITLNTTNRRIEITLPGLTSGTSNSQSGTFRLVGVRIDANGRSGAQTVSAALNETTNNYILSTPGPLTVIEDLDAGIGSIATGSIGGNTNFSTSTIFTNRSVPDTKGSFVVTEGFGDAWRTAAESSNSATATPNGTNIRLTFAGIPAGVTLTLSAVTTGSPSPPDIGFGSATSQSAAAGTATITASSTTTVVVFNDDPDDFQIDYTVSAPGTASLSAGSITVTATHVPIGDGVDNSNAAQAGLPRADQGYPAFAQADVGPVTLVNIVPASTTLLIPLAEKVGAFDTGISVANTTLDAFGTAAGGATPTAGTLKFDFFPATATGAGTACTLTTSSTNRPGFGIAADGTIAAGSTYVVLLSQLLPVSNCAAGDFIGYIFVTANFLNAHGQATISDFRTYSLAANVLVLPPPATSPRALSGTTTVESLGF